MTVNAMNVGVDYNVQYFDGNAGALRDLGDIQTIRITAQKHDIKSMPYNAPPRFGYVPDGYKIEFTITRKDSTQEDMAVLYETAFNNDQLLGPGYLNESVSNSDGSTSRYQYTNCVLFLTDHGDISRDKTVTLRLEGYASTKVQIA